jgi:hypothetical protein
VGSGSERAGRRGKQGRALYSRGEVRDDIDVDAIRASGWFSDAELMSAAQARDPGFEVDVFAQQLARIENIAPRRFEEQASTRCNSSP